MDILNYVFVRIKYIAIVRKPESTMKFFRKIRQQLVVEKKLRNYLLYAIGEIILVVIGILIALAINNGQQKRILEKKEQTYLKGLKTEFQFSTLKLT